MSRTIRQALFRKIAGMPEWQEFRADFQAATGLRVDLVDTLGVAAGGCGLAGNARMCKRMLEDSDGRQVCQRFRQRGMSGGQELGSEAVCDAGLREKVLPLRLSGLPVGYLVVAGYRVGQLAGGDRSRVRHLLRKAGVSFAANEVDDLLESAPHFSPRLWEAYGRWLEMAVREIGGRLNMHAVEPATELPHAVERAMRLIRSRALHDEISLPLVARECGVCAGHLSRLFVRSTGLSFTEFVSRFRVEKAAELLWRSQKPVTEIAFESGFSSLSQFHRVFRRVQGCSPREFRRSAGGGLRNLHE